jgi:hypothetical protein
MTNSQYVNRSEVESSKNKYFTTNPFKRRNHDSQDQANQQSDKLKPERSSSPRQRNNGGSNIISEQDIGSKRQRSSLSPKGYS